MKKIKLTQNKFALVDDENYDWLLKYSWSAHKISHSIWYAVIGKNSILMHRLIMKLSKGDNILIDHINGDGLDNRKENLRIATSKQNQGNSRINLNNKSGYKGVSWHKLAKKWIVQLGNGKGVLYGGLFYDKKEAAKKYNEMATNKFGKYAKLNEI